jgi:hypothetical protein
MNNPVRLGHRPCLQIHRQVFGRYRAWVLELLVLRPVASDIR